MTSTSKNSRLATDSSSPESLNKLKELHQLQPRDRKNPTIWDTLYLDKAIPVDPLSKTYMIRDLQSWTRNYLLIPIKLVANVSLGLIMTLKRLLPFQFRAYGFMPAGVTRGVKRHM